MTLLLKNLKFMNQIKSQIILFDVYVYQNLGAAHSKCWSKFVFCCFLHVFARFRLKNDEKLGEY